MADPDWKTRILLLVLSATSNSPSLWCCTLRKNKNKNKASAPESPKKQNNRAANPELKKDQWGLHDGRVDVIPVLLRVDWQDIFYRDPRRKEKKKKKKKKVFKIHVMISTRPQSKVIAKTEEKSTRSNPKIHHKAASKAASKAAAK